MGACNPKSLEMIKVDYHVPSHGPGPLSVHDEINDVNYSKLSERRKRAFSETHHCSKTDIQTYQSSIAKEKVRQTKRSTLFNQITEKNTSYQTKSSNGTRHSATEKKKMTEIKTQGLFLPEDHSIILSAFESHFLLSQLDHSSMLSLITQLKKYQIEANDNIFLEGEEANSMYFIICGKAEMSKSSTKNLLIKTSKEFFGELGVLEDKALRTYNARGIEKGFLYEITNASFKGLKSRLAKHDSRLETMLENVPLLSYLDEADKGSLIKFVYVKHIKQNEHLTFNEAFYIIKAGRLKCKMENQAIEMGENMFYGINNLLFEALTQEITAIKNTEMYIIPLQAFIEILGVDYRYHIVYPYFRKVMSENKFFSNLFNELQLGPVYQLFSIKKYKQKAIVCHKGTSGKILIILKGKLILKGTHGNDGNEGGDDRSELKFGSVYGDQLITSGLVLNSDIIANTSAVVLECEWSEMKAKAETFNSSIVKRMKKLRRIEFTRNSNESKLLEIASIVHKKTFKKKELICNKGFNNDSFFLILKGEAKLKLKNKTIRRYGKGNCFGEMYVFEIEDQGTSILASSESISVYAMPGEYFKNLIGDNTYNDYIKKKMCIEDREIDLADLFCVKELSKRCCIAHNSIECYLVKRFSKDSHNDLNQADNCEKAMKHLDHPFIVKCVKRISSKHYDLVLYEHLRNGISLDQVIQSKQLFLNKISSVVLYSASIVMVLDYIHSKRFLHRNLTPENIIIDSNGYIKLIGFENTKKLLSKDKLSTSTVVGVPCYTAPEVLKGDNYSFECDYWSLGVVLYHFYFERLPFDGEDNDDPLAIYTKIIEKDINVRNCDAKLKGFFKALLEIDSLKRCSSILTTKQLALFKELNFEDLLSCKLEPQFIPSRRQDDHCDNISQSKDSNALLNMIDETWESKF